MIITDELREELNQAAVATSQAYATVRNITPGIILKISVSFLLLINY